MASDFELIEMEKDLLNRIESLDPTTLGLMSRAELEFAFKQENIKQVVIHTEDCAQFLLLLYFGKGKPLLTYATTEPRRPCYFKRVPTILSLLGDVTSGKQKILFYIKQLPSKE